MTLTKNLEMCDSQIMKLISSRADSHYIHRKLEELHELILLLPSSDGRLVVEWMKRSDHLKELAKKDRGKRPVSPSKRTPPTKRPSLSYRRQHIPSSNRSASSSTSYKRTPKIQRSYELDKSSTGSQQKHYRERILPPSPSKDSNKPAIICLWCGREHYISDCPKMKNRQCYRCGDFGHHAKYCRR